MISASLERFVVCDEQDNVSNLRADRVLGDMRRDRAVEFGVVSGCQSKLRTSRSRRGRGSVDMQVRVEAYYQCWRSSLEWFLPVARSAEEGWWVCHGRSSGGDRQGSKLPEAVRRCPQGVKPKGQAEMMGDQTPRLPADYRHPTQPCPMT